MSSHLIATELYPAFGPKALLYPGAIARSYIKNRTFPSYSKLPKLYNLTNLRKTSASTDLRHLEILTGSYLAVLGLVRQGRTSLFGTLLIVWGFVREVVLKKYSADMNSGRSIHIYPVTMCIALLCAFLAIRKDVRKLIRCCRTRRGANLSYSSSHLIDDTKMNWILVSQQVKRTQVAISRQGKKILENLEMFDGSLAMPFHTLNPCHILGHVNTHRALHKSRLQPVLAIPPSSILLHTDESGKFPDSKNGSGLRGRDSSDSLLSQANTVGIIGGISVNSALNFLKKLVHGSSKEGKDCFPFVLCSDPVLNKELLLHERNSRPYPSRHNEKSPSDHSAIAENLQNKRVFLEKSGVQCIVMPCHILHSWHDEVSKGCSVPFLHMGECVARELKEAKLKPLEAGSPLRIGLLASNATLAAGFYQEKLQSE
ncbi:hypothetical protein NC651_008235 [Populus alba x Populus x berolinensis]|nr:hypothetical protein NC651_008235 [Populus alba x Populus x berolinensis]